MEWDLGEIKPKDMQKEQEEISSKASSLEKKRAILRDINSKEFIDIIHEMEELKKKTSRLSSYCYLKFSENSKDQETLAEMSKVDNFLAKINNKLIFFSLWFKDLPEKRVKELIKDSGKYHYYLETMRLFKPYTLKENEEKIISIKDLTGANALNNIYNIFTSQFEFRLKGKKLSQEELINFVRDKSPAVRKLAYLELLGRYKENKEVIGEIYRSLVNDWREESVNLRNYKSPINARNVANDLPDKAVENLLQACQKNQQIFHRFFEIKRKRLGLKKFTRFDLYAPIKETKDKFTYDESIKWVLEAFYGFSEQFGREAERIINEKHIHSKIQKNKQSGAFCMSVNHDLSPYVLVNFTGKTRDVSTLAHELGHGVHHNLARGQTELTYHSVLPLAETASIFGEMVLSEKMAEKNPEIVKSLIFEKLDDIYASIIRQAGFVIFEKKAHEMIEQGKTMEEVSDEYLRLLREQLGKNIEVDEIFKYEWLYIPHIYHTPFYCYAYAFGNLLTLALWEKYKEQGENFAEKIMEMLSKGGSDSPIEITKIVGVDITSEKFWESGFRVIEEMIRKIE